MTNNYQKDLIDEVNNCYLLSLTDEEFAIEFSRYITLEKNSKNPFLLASANGAEYIKIAFNRYFKFSTIPFKEFQEINIYWQIQLLIIQMFSHDSIKRTCICESILANENPYLLFFDWKILGNDKFKIIWFSYVKEGMQDYHESPDHSDIESYESFHKYDGVYEKCLNEEYFWDWESENYRPYFLTDTALLVSNFSEFVKYSKPSSVNVHKQSWGHWNKYDFVHKVISEYGIKYLKDGPPSFHKNKEILKKILAEFPEYYKEMKNRALKKDKDIVSTVIRANPALIDTIPKQYIDAKLLNPFRLATIAADKPETVEKIIQPFLGLVCITGRLKSFKTKKEASNKLELAGYSVSKNLTMECDYLLNETNVKSSKSLKLKNWQYSHIKEINNIEILLNKELPKKPKLLISL